MKSLTGRIPSARGWALLLTMFLGAGLMIAACGDEETPAPTVPTPTPPPTPPPPPPEPEPEPPAVPTGLQVSGTGLDFIEWSWTAVEGADGYMVQFSADEEFTDGDETTVVAEGTSHRVGNLAPGTTGFLRVRAFTGEGDSRLLSGWSSHRTGTSAVPPAPMPPAAPTGLMVSDTGEDFIEWTWTAVEGADGYLVQFSTDEDFTDYREAPVAEGTSYRVRDLAPGTTGYLRVRAFTGEGDSRLLGDWSLHRTGTSALPPAPMPPATPTGLTFSSEAGADFIEWSWTPVEGADGYQVQFSTNEDFTDHREALVTEGTSHRVGDLAPGTIGYLRVRAFADEGDSRLFSDWSATGTGMTSATPPAAPTGLMVSDIGEDFLVWSWTAVEDADGYIVQFSTDEDFTGDEETLVARGTSHRVGGLDPGTTGYLRVLAFTGEGASRLRSPWSLHRTGMTTPAPLEAPAVPTGLEVSDWGVDFIEWKWKPIPGVGGYEVQFSANEAFTDEDEVIPRTAEEINYRRTGLDAEADAYLRVRAYVGEGDRRVWSAWSTHVTGTTEPELPATPANLQVMNTGSDFIVWTWNRVARASGYEVQFSRQAVFTDSDPKTVVTGMANTTYRAANLPSSTRGYLRVRAWSGTSSAPLNGEWSASVPGTTKAPPPAVALSRPANVRSIGRDEDSITLRWSEVENADHYQVRQRVSTATAWSNASCGGDDHLVEEISCQATGLDGGVTYDFGVRAVPDSSDSTRFEASPWSAEIEVTTTGGTPPAPAGGDAGELNLRWSSKGTFRVATPRVLNGSSIVFTWDRIPGAEYDIMVLTTANAKCPGQSVAASTTESDRLTGWWRAGRITSKTESVNVATVKGLCVRTADFAKFSFVRGVGVPEHPDVPTSNFAVESSGKTTALRWSDVDVVKDFSYTTRLVERRPNDTTTQLRDDTSTRMKAVQAACEDGRLLTQRTAPLSRMDQTVTVTSGLRPYRDYILCMKYANDAGNTEWVVPASNTVNSVSNVIKVITTVPAKPPMPVRSGAKSSTVIDSDPLVATSTITVWDLTIAGRNDVPEKAANYNYKTITYNVLSEGQQDGTGTTAGTTSSDATHGDRTTTPSEAACSRSPGTVPVSKGTWSIVGSSGVNVTETFDGLEIQESTPQHHAITGSNVHADRNAQYVHLCVQGKLDDTRLGPWVISRATTVPRW